MIFTASTVGQVTVYVENSANLAKENSYDLGFSVPGAAAPTGSVTVNGFPSGMAVTSDLSAGIDSGTYAPEGAGTFVVPASVAGGTYPVTVSYTGDGQYSSASTKLSVLITGLNFALTNSGAITVTEGGTGSSTITVTPAGGFTGTVALACSVSSTTTGVSCQVSPAQANLTGTGGVNSTLTITTTSASGALTSPGWNFFASTGGLSLAMIFFAGFPAGRRKWRGMLALFVVLGCIAGISCGGGGASTAGSASYTVTVTGTSGSASAITKVLVTVNK